MNLFPYSRYRPSLVTVKEDTAPDLLGVLLDYLDGLELQQVLALLVLGL